MRKIFIIGICFVVFQQSFAQEVAIRATIDRMFQALYKSDTATLRTCFTPGALLMTYSFDSRGNPRAKGETLNDFLRGVAIMGPADMEEKLIHWQFLVDDGIASVWTPYEFYFEGKFSHCGVNSFQMMHVMGEWKITMITDTRRRTACPNSDTETVLIDSLVNLWHHAAAVADENVFFGFMPVEGVYIGTDASERWLRDELRDWSRKYFERESAWDFKPLSRNITIGPGGHLAWFDELLDTWMGICRSTGILEKRDGVWKLTYYHLSIAVPNDKLDGYRLLIDKT